MTAIAIILLNQQGLETAQKLKSHLGTAEIWGLEGRTTGVDKSFKNTGDHLRNLYEAGVTIIGFCAAGILIRALSPCLENKRAEPPVLAMSDDASVAVPLLGGLTGANELSVQISRALGGVAAITASGARRYAVQLEAPPQGYALANPEDAKRITSDILNGATIALDGPCPWLEDSRLPLSGSGDITLRISCFNEALPKNGLLYHPKKLLLEIEDKATTLDHVLAAFKETGFALPALAAVMTSAAGPVGTAKLIAQALGVPLRLVENYRELSIARRISLKASELTGAAVESNNNTSTLSLIETKTLPELRYLGRSTGKVSVIGLGPGAARWRTPEVTTALENADCLVGYKTYLDMVPKRFMQQRFASDNRVEIERAKEALDLAKTGKHVVVVSSGDPGIFAMAGAVLEALDRWPATWKHIDLEILPGLSAMQGAAAKSGAPLGHDFAVISLSDIRKPFDIIEKRLIAAAESDMVIAIYNPASKTRRHQVEQMKARLLEHKAPETLTLLARNIGRDGEQTEITTLGALDTNRIDMRTMLIIGSSKTRQFNGPDGQPLLYTPRSYE